MRAIDRMPTAGRLLAAVCFGGLAWVASEMFRPLMQEGTDFGWFNYVNLTIGVVCGWFIVGRRLRGGGLTDAISIGLTGLGAMLFWALLLHSLYEMLSRSLERRYKDPFEALQGMFEIALGYMQVMLNAPLIALLVGGAIASGLISNGAMRRWG
ncbi:tellurium resistance protein [Roseovarius sp. TE539]|uniref:TrgA family protein n=1 Tax=Roseovarius sp. TE539 TaxID=2249812 RepID=UPI000DE0FE07|nr:TrgA family protein [Roseovarius sp. TE539]RBI74719.1 tellurium resistance protein [Roseovarius sp. TE539]